jgi:hypothetical protein
MGNPTGAGLGFHQSSLHPRASFEHEQIPGNPVLRPESQLSRIHSDGGDNNISGGALAQSNLCCFCPRWQTRRKATVADAQPLRPIAYLYSLMTFVLRLVLSH